MKNSTIKHPFQSYLKNVVQTIKRSVDTQLEPHDLSGPQAKIVAFIGEKQNQGISICQKDIEAVMHITAASITSLLQGLEKKGFIQRSTSTADERIKELALTQRGKKLIDTFDALFSSIEKKIIQGMSEQDKELFLKQLCSIHARFEK